MAHTIGALVELRIEDLTVDGGGLARLAHSGGRVVFTDRGLPGETVRARLESVSARFLRAVVVETLAPSPHAGPVHCAYALPGEPEDGGSRRPACGGCSWPGLDYAAECAWKENQLRQTLRRVGGVSKDLLDDPAVFESIVPSPETLRYRNKMEFAFAPDPAAPGLAVLGLRARASHAVLAVADCPLAGFAAGPVLRLVREWALREKLPAWGNASGKAERRSGRGFLRYLVLRRSPAGGCIAELITGPCAADSRMHDAVSRLADVLCPSGAESPCAGFIHSVRAAGAAVAYGEEVRLQRGVTVMEENLAGVTLRAPIPAFLQVNAGAASRAYETVRGYAALAARNWKAATRSGGIVDAYCGVGGLGILAAGLAEAGGAPLLGLESDRTAVIAARENAVRNGIASAVFMEGDVADSLAALGTRPALVLADPPRAGLSPAVCGELPRLEPESIILVSCNPATLARDVAALSGSYALAKARGVDLFPHTPHMESVLLLERRV